MEADDRIMRRIKEWLANRKRRQAIVGIRRHMAWFGYDLSHVSDDEIEAGVIRVGKKMADTGMSAQQDRVYWLRLLIDDEQGLTPYPLHLGDWPLSEAVERAVAESRRQAVACGNTIAAVGLSSPRVVAPIVSLVPCSHPGCQNHVTHPCEGCGKQWGSKDAVCDHVWGTDGLHNNEFCKKCFVAKPKKY